MCGNAANCLLQNVNESPVFRYSFIPARLKASHTHTENSSARVPQCDVTCLQHQDKVFVPRRFGHPTTTKAWASASPMTSSNLDRIVIIPASSPYMSCVLSNRGRLQELATGLPTKLASKSTLGISKSILSASMRTRRRTVWHRGSLALIKTTQM